MPNKPYITTDWKDLSFLEGEELQIRRWIWDFNEFRNQPSKVIFLKDYPNTVLLELIYTDCEWGIRMPPRAIRKMISKSAMACGDIRLRELQTGTTLTGGEITRLNRHAEAEQVQELIWE